MSRDDIWSHHRGNNIPKKWSICSKIVIATVGFTSKLWGEWLNRFEVHNKQILLDSLNNRPLEQPLLTVSNHISCVDDPLIWGVLPMSSLSTAKRGMRWILAASDVCFTKHWHSVFFSLGRCVPVHRGGGVYQRSMDFMLDKMKNGAWIHTFAEECFAVVIGHVNMTGEFLRIKWGIGRLVADSETLPIVIPMWLKGVDDIMPNHKPYIPRIGQKVTFLIGEPLDFREQLKVLRDAHKNPKETRKAITDRIQEELAKLKQKAEELHNT